MSSSQARVGSNKRRGSSSSSSSSSSSASASTAAAAVASAAQKGRGKGSDSDGGDNSYVAQGRIFSSSKGRPLQANEVAVLRKEVERLAKKEDALLKREKAIEERERAIFTEARAPGKKLPLGTKENNVAVTSADGKANAAKIADQIAASALRSIENQKKGLTPGAVVIERVKKEKDAKNPLNLVSNAEVNYNSTAASAVNVTAPRHRRRSAAEVVDLIQRRAEAAKAITLSQKLRAAEKQIEELEAQLHEAANGGGVSQDIISEATDEMKEECAKLRREKLAALDARDKALERMGELQGCIATMEEANASAIKTALSENKILSDQISALQRKLDAQMKAAMDAKINFENQMRELKMTLEQKHRDALQQCSDDAESRLNAAHTLHATNVQALEEQLETSSKELELSAQAGQLARSEAGHLHQKLALAEDRVAELESAASEAERRHRDDSASASARFNAQILELQAQHTNEMEQLRATSKAKDEELAAFEACKASLEDAERKMKAADAKLLTLQQQLSSLSQEKNDATKEELERLRTSVALAEAEAKKTAEEAEQLRKRLGELQQLHDDTHKVQISALREELKNSQSLRTELAGKLRFQDSELQALRANEHTLNLHLQDEKHKVASLKSDLASSSANEASLQATVAFLQKELQSAARGKQDRASLEKQMAALSSHVKDVEGQLKSKSAEVESLSQQLLSLMDSVEQKMADEIKLKQRVKDLKKSATEREDVLRKQMAGLRDILDQERRANEAAVSSWKSHALQAEADAKELAIKLNNGKRRGSKSSGRLSRKNSKQKMTSADSNGNIHVSFLTVLIRTFAQLTPLEPFIEPETKQIIVLLLYHPSYLHRDQGRRSKSPTLE